MAVDKKRHRRRQLKGFLKRRTKKRPTVVSEQVTITKMARAAGGGAKTPLEILSLLLTNQVADGR